MNIERFLFTTLTTYLIAPKTLPEDKDNITKRILQNCALDDKAYFWVYDNDWQGGETKIDVIKAWDRQNISQLERANELIKIAYEHATTFEGFIDKGVQITPFKIEKKFQNYLDDYGLDYE